MKSRVSSSVFVLIATLLLVLVVALFLRVHAPVAITADPLTASQGVPAFTSATFPDGDILNGLGPEWTYLRQSKLNASDARTLPGLVPDREAIVRLTGEDLEMTIAIFDLKDKTQLDAALAPMTLSKIGERSGWVVPLNDISGGHGFLLVGERSALLVSLSGSAEWPSTLPSAVTSFLTAIRVP